MKLANFSFLFLVSPCIFNSQAVSAEGGKACQDSLEAGLTNLYFATAQVSATQEVLNGATSGKNQQLARASRVDSERSGSRGRVLSNEIATAFRRIKPSADAESQFNEAIRRVEQAPTEARSLQSAEGTRHSRDAAILRAVLQEYGFNADLNSMRSREVLLEFLTKNVENYLDSVETQLILSQSLEALIRQLVKLNQEGYFANAKPNVKEAIQCLLRLSRHVDLIFHKDHVRVRTGGELGTNVKYAAYIPALKVVIDHVRRRDLGRVTRTFYPGRQKDSVRILLGLEKDINGRLAKFLKELGQFSRDRKAALAILELVRTLSDSDRTRSNPYKDLEREAVDVVLTRLDRFQNTKARLTVVAGKSRLQPITRDDLLAHLLNIPELNDMADRGLALIDRPNSEYLRSSSSYLNARIAGETILDSVGMLLSQLNAKPLKTGASFATTLASEFIKRRQIEEELQTAKESLRAAVKEGHLSPPLNLRSSIMQLESRLRAEGSRVEDLNQLRVGHQVELDTDGGFQNVHDHFKYAMALLDCLAATVQKASENTENTRKDRVVVEKAIHEIRAELSYYFDAALGEPKKRPRSKPRSGESEGESGESGDGATSSHARRPESIGPTERAANRFTNLRDFFFPGGRKALDESEKVGRNFIFISSERLANMTLARALKLRAVNAGSVLFDTSNQALHDILISYVAEVASQKFAAILSPVEEIDPLSSIRSREGISLTPAHMRRRSNWKIVRNVALIAALSGTITVGVREGWVPPVISPPKKPRPAPRPEEPKEDKKPDSSGGIFGDWGDIFGNRRNNGPFPADPDSRDKDEEESEAETSPGGITGEDTGPLTEPGESTEDTKKPVRRPNRADLPGPEK